MTNRYTSYEDTGVAFDVDTFALTAARHDLDVIAEDITPERGHIYPATSTGRTRRGRITGPKSWTGSIESPLFPIDATSLLFYSLGTSANTPDMPVMGVDTHVVSQALTLPNFICEIGRDDVGHQYTGCVCTGSTIDYAPDATMTQSTDVFFRKEQATAVLDTITFEDFDVSDRAFGGVEVTPALGPANTAAPSAVTFIEASSISWTNEFSDDAFALGSEFLPANIVANYEVTGSFDMRFTAVTDAYADVVGSVNKAFELDAGFGSGAAERQVLVRMDRISYDSTTLPTDGNQRYVQTVEFTAENADGVGDSSAGNPLEIQVINTDDDAAFTA